MTISASTSSATLRVLENGALNTGTPRRIASPRSIWFVPMQNAPIAVSLVARASTAASSCVRERMPTKWASAMAAARASPSSAFGCVTTCV